MTNWFRENRWLGTFLIIFGIGTIGAFWFLLSAKGSADDADAQFASASLERSRLERLDPFPSEANFRKMKTHLENYSASLEELKEELKTHALATTPLAPNEFQIRLRQAMLATAEKARANKVKLPDNFALGFEEFTTALPNTDAAPLLGQELAQAELLASILIEARVDGISAFARNVSFPPGTTPPAGPGRKPAAATPTGVKTIERGIVDVTFAGSASATRRMLNQIASSPQQFFIARTLHVHSLQDKGPPRDQPAQPGAAAPPAPAKTPSNTALSFIVGNEHLETSARIEMIRLTY